MARNRNSLPTYRHHKKTDRAVITGANDLGARQDILLPGKFNSPESVEEYKSICARIQTNKGTLLLTAAETADMTIAEFVLRFMELHASKYYLEPERGRRPGNLNVLPSRSDRSSGCTAPCSLPISSPCTWKPSRQRWRPDRGKPTRSVPRFAIATKPVGLRGEPSTPGSSASAACFAGVAPKNW